MMVLIGLNSAIDGLQLTVIRDEARKKESDPDYIVKEKARDGRDPAPKIGKDQENVSPSKAR